MIKLNQKGFAAFEVVLIVVALAAVGTAGYFAYQARQDKTDYSVAVPKAKTTAPVKTTAPAPAPSVQPKPAMFAVKELGIQFTLPSELNGLSYAYSADGVAQFTTSSLINIGGKYCSADSAPLGGIRLTDTVGTGEQIMASIGSKRLVYIHPQATCSDNSQATELETKQIAELTKALKTAKSL